MSDNLVEERVVRMQFDNSNFQKNVNQTIESLNELDESLKFEDAAKGTGTIQKAIDAVSFNTINQAIDKTKDGFDAMSVMAINALTRIQNKAMDLGESMIKSLTTDQISSGWNKYIEKTSNVQTLVNSTGLSIDEINKYLDELMWYSDETSYSFSNMTSALATMTASGGKIENLIPMIEGIANATAYAGKGAAEFSRVIYNLNQSYSQGYLSTMDWRSVQLAGASSKQLQQILIDTAEELGTVEKGVYTLQNFSDALTDKAFTSSVMEKAFGKFATLTEAAREAVDAGTYKTAAEAIEALADSYDEVAVRAFQSAQEAKSFTEAIDATKDAVASAWMRIFENIFGNYEESKTLWTKLANDLYDLFVPGLDAKAELLEQWHDPKNGGYSDFMDGAIAMFQGFINITNAVSDALSHVFPPTTLEALLKFSKTFKMVGEKFQQFTSYISPFNDAVDETAETVTNTADAVSGAISEVTDDAELLLELANKVINGDYGNGQDRIDQLTNLGYSYNHVQNKVNELLGCSKRYDTEGGTLIKTSKTLADANKEVSKTLTDVTDNIDMVSSAQARAVDTTETFSQKLAWSVSGMASAISIIVEAIKAVNQVIVTPIITKVVPALLDKILTLTSAIGKVITKVADNIKANNTFVKALETIVGMISAIRELKNIIAEVIFQSKDLESIQELFTNISNLGNGFNNIRLGFVDQISKLFATLNNNEIFSSLKDTVIKGMVSGLNTVVKLINKLWIALSPIGSFLNTGLNEAITKIDFNVISNGLSKLSTSFSSFGTVLSTFWEAINKSGGGWSKIKLKIQNWFYKLLPDTADSARKTFKQFKSLFNGFSADFNGFNLTTLKQTSALSTSMGSFTGVFSDLFSKIQTVFQPVIKLLGPIIETVKTLFGEISDIFHGFDLQYIADLISQFATLYMVYNVTKSISSLILSISKFVADIGSAVANLIKSVSSIANGIASITKAVGALLTGINSSISKIASGIQFFAIASGILLIAAACYILAKIDPESLKSAVTAIAIVTIIIAAVTKLMGQVGATDAVQSASNAAMLIAFSLGLIALVYTFKKLLDILNGNYDLADGLFLLGTLLGMLLGSIYILRKIMTGIGDADWKGTLAQAVLLLSFTKALKGIIDALVLLKDYDFWEMQSAMIMLLEVVGILAILALSASKLKVSNGIGLVALVGSIWLFTKVIDAIMALDMQAIISAIPQFIVVFGLLALVIHMVKDLYTETAGLGAVLAGLGFAVLMIAVAMKIIGSMSLAEITTSGLIMVAIIAVLSLFVYSAQRFESQAKSMLGMAAMLAALGVCMILIAVAVRIIGEMDTAKAIIGTIGIGALILALAQVSKYARANETSFKYMVGMAVVIAAIALSLAVLTFFDTAKLLASTVAMTSVIVALGVMAYAISKMNGDIKKALTNLLVIGALLAGVVVALYILLTLDNVDQILNVAMSLAIVIAALGVAAGVIGVVGAAAPAALNGLLVIGAVVLAIGVLFASIAGLLYLYPDLGAKIDEIGVILEKAGQAIGGFFGGIVSGVMTSSMKCLPECATYLATFSAIIMTIPDGVSEKVGSLSNVFDALQTMASAGLASNLDSLIGKFTGDRGLTQMMKELLGTGEDDGLVPQLIKFADACQDLNDDKYKNALNAVIPIMKKLVQVLDTIPESGGLLQKFTGEHDWATLGDGLADLGEALKKFGESVEDIEQYEDGFNAAVPMMKDLVEILNSIDSVGGIITQWFTGTTTWSNLSDGLEEMGTALLHFGWKVGNIEKWKAGIEASVPIMRLLAEFMQEIPSVGGIVNEWFGGQVKWSTLSNGLPELGTALSNFADSMSGIYAIEYGWEGLDRAISFIERIIGAIVDLQNSSAIVENDGGTYFGGWTHYVTGLKDFMTSIKESSEILKNVYTVDVNKMLDIIEHFVNITFWDDPTIATKGGEALEKLGENVKNFLTSIKGTVGEDGENISPATILNTLVEDISSFGEQISAMDLSTFTTFGANIVNSIISGMNGTAAISDIASGVQSEVADSGVTGTGTMYSALVGLITKMLNAVETKKTTLIDSGKSIINYIKDGMTSADSVKAAEGAAKTICDKIIDKLKTFQEKFYEAGEYLAQGLADGMQSQASIMLVEQAGTTLGNAATQATRAAAQVYSPSRFTMWVGEMIGEGLARGMNSKTDAVGESATSMTEVAINSIDAMANSIDRMNSSFSVPVAPVLDLSKVSTKAAFLDTSIARNNAANVNSSFNIDARTDDFAKLVSITSRMLDSIQNGTDVYLNEDVLVGRINRRLGQL